MLGLTVDPWPILPREREGDFSSLVERIMSLCVCVCVVGEVDVS